ncbi:hypothetical protein I656_01519 [Geobacillus sp. WSUCF1]|nr:hypothetical protein I656_01519 [Geobacillus sp. WSUCF1]
MFTSCTVIIFFYPSFLYLIALYKKRKKVNI